MESGCSPSGVVRGRKGDAIHMVSVAWTRDVGGGGELLRAASSHLPAVQRIDTWLCARVGVDEPVFAKLIIEIEAPLRGAHQETRVLRGCCHRLISTRLRYDSRSLAFVDELLMSRQHTLHGFTSLMMLMSECAWRSRVLCAWRALLRETPCGQLHSSNRLCPPSPHIQLHRRQEHAHPPLTHP